MAAKTFGREAAWGIEIGALDAAREFVAAYRDPAFLASIEGAGGRYARADARDDSAQQLTDIDNLIAQGAKVLIILAKDADAKAEPEARRDALEIRTGSKGGSWIRSADRLPSIEMAGNQEPPRFIAYAGAKPHADGRPR